MSKNYRIKEFCNYSYYDRNKYLDLEYSLKTVSPDLKDKVNLKYELIDKIEINNKLCERIFEMKEDKFKDEKT